MAHLQCLKKPLHGKQDLEIFCFSFGQEVGCLGGHD